MSEMVERVAKGLWVLWWGKPEIFDRCATRKGGDTNETQSMWDKSHSAAYAAIEAMREPTQDQVAAAQRAVSGFPRDEAIRAIWRAAITAALKE